MTKKFVATKWEGMVEIGQGESVPMIKKLTSKEFSVLHAIALFQWEGGRCDSTYEQLAQICPFSRRTVISAVDTLRDFTYEGKPVIEVESTTFKGKQRNVYTLLPNPLFATYGEQLMSESFVSTSEKIALDTSEEIALSNEVTSKELTNKKNIKEAVNMKNKQVIGCFMESYEKKYMNPFKVNWGRDNKFTTKFLKTVTDLTDEEILSLVEIIVENYDKWSTNSAKYPLSIITLSTEWIQKKAREELKKGSEELSQIEERSVVASERQKKSLDSIMSRVKKKGGQ